MLPLYIEVKAHAPTDTKGKRVSAKIKGKGRRYYPWDYQHDAAVNMRAAAYEYAQGILNRMGFAFDDPVLTEVRSDNTGLPIGYVWEG